ncbi:hypothetical protein [Paludisphaera soli]|uniref:hypothetical protein n=1 Tax=Paludisphaera soli TaxID=2712865 RepID=UPI0013ED4982|nr:hypothetical protein [Paludisphaera soli]
MDPREFVASLKTSIQEVVDSEVSQMGSRIPSEIPDGPSRFAYLDRFAAWFQKLADADKETARDLLRFTAEGGLFATLTYLDNLATLVPGQGRFELWHVADGDRRLLNDPDGDLLIDLFNDLP